MGKKSNSLPLIYLIGMVVTAVGFFCPMFKSILGTTPGYKFINFDNFGFVTIGALLIVAGAIAGIVFCFVGGKSAKLLRLICAIVSIAGGIVLVVGFNDNKIYQAIAKGFLKHAYFGFYMVVAGWLVGLCGAITNK